MCYKGILPATAHSREKSPAGGMTQGMKDSARTDKSNHVVPSPSMVCWWCLAST